MTTDCNNTSKNWLKKRFADRPTLLFSAKEPETHLFFCLIHLIWPPAPLIVSKWWKRVFSYSSLRCCCHESCCLNAWLACYIGSLTGTGPCSSVVRDLADALACLKRSPRIKMVIRMWPLHNAGSLIPFIQGFLCMLGSDLSQYLQPVPYKFATSFGVKIFIVYFCWLYALQTRPWFNIQSKWLLLHVSQPSYLHCQFRKPKPGRWQGGQTLSTWPRNPVCHKIIWLVKCL